jgi:hypothetical protein
MSEKCQERTKDNALPDVTYARPKPDRAVGRLYFVWVPSHATRLAEFVGIGRGVDLNIYIWIVISLLLLTQSPPQAARAYGADHRTGEGTCHRERPLASIDVMSPRVAGPPGGRLIQVAFP